MRTRVSLVGMVAAYLVVGCGGAPDLETDGASRAALTSSVSNGERLFNKALPGTNGRSCATCHVEEEHTTLLPASVSARLAANPNDPLFNVLDADDPDAPVPTYRHLQAGLVRVTLPLAENVDLIDEGGALVTPADRTISVWRGVPTVENTAVTAPYQLDGRAPTLEAQALGALHAHSQIDRDPPAALLQQIADFERTFSSPPSAPGPFPAGSDEALGQALFQRACTPCHGGSSGTQIIHPVDMPLHPFINPDGSVTLITLPGVGNFPAKFCETCLDDDFLDLGIAFGTQLGELAGTNVVDFPHYRLRFYTDATRTAQLVDLPPPSLPGPNLAPQAFSTDPGRAIITGDPGDFEAFDVPQLRGCANTPPYFHDNSAPDLQAVLDIYSRFILPQLPALHLPRVVPPAGPGLPAESLTQAQKQQIIAFLQTL